MLSLAFAIDDLQLTQKKNHRTANSQKREGDASNVLRKCDMCGHTHDTEHAHTEHTDDTTNKRATRRVRE